MLPIPQQQQALAHKMYEFVIAHGILYPALLHNPTLVIMSNIKCPCKLCTIDSKSLTCIRP